MTREEVIESLENIKYINTYHRCREGIAIDKAIEALKEPERKWIPVSERLPEKDGYYFVTKRFMDGRIRTDIEPFWVDADWWKSELHFDGISLWEVFAWQPLPEPYKAGEQE